ncbi:MAG: HAD family acid phosphatase [Candidatus Acidiferrales bacterium]
MKRLLIVMFVICASCSSVFAQVGSSTGNSVNSQEPENHAIEVQRLLLYHNSGEYEMQIREVANAARDYLQAKVAASAASSDKLAAVFDIDETALSSWAAMSDCGFCSYSVESKLYTEDHNPAIAPVLELFNYAKKNGVHVFFLTGRHESERDVTIKNLTEAGYSGWAELILRPDNDKSPARAFKPKERQKIEAKGYRIILNIGDQASDLAGCCAERVFKLPNPFYLVQ